MSQGAKKAGPSAFQDAVPDAGKSSFSYLKQGLAKVYRSPGLNAKAKSKIFGRLVINPGAAIRIERRLEQLGLGCITELQPRLLEKFARPYLVNGLSSQEKVDFICAHYQVLARFFSRPAIETMYTAGLGLLGGFLAELEAGIELHYDSAMEKEGELTLSLLTRGARAYSVTFVLQADAICIGSLQGSKSALDEIRRFTKASHGVRPQNFVVFLVRIIAAHLGLPTIRAIRNDSHVYNTRRRTQDRVQFDYDTFWGETGGQAVDERFVELPLIQPRKEIKDVVMNKRAQYRRRYDFFDGCAEALKAELDALRVTP